MPWDCAARTMAKPSLLFKSMHGNDEETDCLRKELGGKKWFLQSVKAASVRNW